MKNIISVIKYEGDNQTFIWKHPNKDFNSGTQLIVHESQEAIFFMNGQALDRFGPGRHTLNSQNIPIINNFFNRSTEDETPFHCEIYFINKTEQMAVKWGTDSKVEYLDPIYNFPIKIGANGEMNLMISNSRKLLVHIVGTETSLTQKSLVKKFRGFLMAVIKTYLSEIIINLKINIFNIDKHLVEISKYLKERLEDNFESYGISLNKFYVGAIQKPESDLRYIKFKDLHYRKYSDVAEAELEQQVDIIRQTTKAKQLEIESQGKASKRNIEGYTYQDERTYDVAEKVASNEGVGEMSNLGIGLGVMSGIGGTVGNSVSKMTNQAVGNVTKTVDKKTISCEKCGATIPEGSKFCIECGNKIMAKTDKKVKCPNCGENVPPGKFCINCGSSLIKICPECGAELSYKSKFCLECGAKIGDDKNEK